MFRLTLYALDEGTVLLTLEGSSSTTRNGGRMENKLQMVMTVSWVSVELNLIEFTLGIWQKTKTSHQRQIVKTKTDD